MAAARARSARSPASDAASIWLGPLCARAAALSRRSDSDVPARSLVWAGRLPSLVRSLVFLLLLIPTAAAQDTVQGTYPNDAEVPDPEESVETGPGMTYGAAVVLGIMAFALALAWVGWRQARRPPSPP